MYRRTLCALLLTPIAWAARETVIIDTDSGLFGDDGAAVVMMLRSPQQAAVAGITIVPGNVWSPQGAEYMLHILDLAKHSQVPLYLGAEAPLLHTAAMAHESERRWGKLEFMGAFADNPTEVKAAPGAKLSQHKPQHRAIEFLIGEIERRPGAVTILAIGPLTNIALAIQLRPDIQTKIKQIVFMGGNVKVAGNASPAAEFNFWFDPEAARVVLRSKIPRKVMFGLDICNLAPLHKAEFDQIAAAHTSLADLYRQDLGDRYPGFLHNPRAVGYMWDSLAAAWLIDPEFVKKSETRYLDVLTAWGRFYGATAPLDRRIAPDATPVTVMTELDFLRVFTLYKDLLTRQD